MIGEPASGGADAAVHIPPAMTELATGDLIGPYRIVGELAGGGYRAIDDASARRVWIELGPSEGWRDAAVRMLRAQRLVESLQHPGIARIIADRRPWIAAEVPNGLGLYDLIARRTMPGAEVTALVHDLADVLAHAHAHGVVHRALALRSIVLATGDRAFPLCIADWGRVAEPSAYTAPEPAGDGRVDVYALGVIAFRAATHKFPAVRLVDVAGVTGGLATLIARMLAVDPAERPTAAEVCALAAELPAGGDPIGDAERALAEPPELAPFADDDVRGAPRFARPKWTPAPSIVSSQAALSASGEISVKSLD